MSTASPPSAETADTRPPTAAPRGTRSPQAVRTTNPGGTSPLDDASESTAGRAHSLDAAGPPRGGARFWPPPRRTGRCPGPRAQGRRRGRHRAAGRGPLLCGGAGAGPRGREATPRRHRDAGRGPLLCGGAGRAPPPGRPPTLAARRPPPARPSARRRGYSHTHSSTTYA